VINMTVIEKREPRGIVKRFKQDYLNVDADI
jgi:hypothetical protein